MNDESQEIWRSDEDEQEFQRVVTLTIAAMEKLVQTRAAARQQYVLDRLQEEMLRLRPLADHLLHKNVMSQETHPEKLMRKETPVQQEFSAVELEQMIGDYMDYYNNPIGRSDIEAEAANRLQNNSLFIAQQLLRLLKTGSSRMC